MLIIASILIDRTKVIRSVALFFCITQFHFIYAQSYAMQLTIDSLLLNAYNTQNSNSEKSIQFSLKAIELSQLHHYAAGEAQAYVRLGYVYKFNKAYSQSYELFMKGLEIAKRYGLTRIKALSLNNLGMLQYELGNLDEAITLMHRSRKLYNHLTLSRMLANNYVNLGRLYIEIDSLQLAKDYFARSLKHYNDEWVGEPSHIETYTLLGELYLKENIRDSSYFHIKQAVDRNITHRQKFLAGHNINLLAKLFSLQQERDSVIYYLELGLSDSLFNNNQEELIQMVASLAQIYDTLDIATKFEKYNRLALQLRRQYSEHKKQENIDLHRSQITSWKNINELEEKRTNDKIKTADLEAQRKLLIAFMAFSAIVILLMILILRTRGRLNKHMKLSLHEKEILLREVHHRVKNNLQTISGFLYLQNRKIVDKETQQIIDAVRNRIQAMAFIHQTLFNDSNALRIELSDFIIRLLNHHIESYGLNTKQVFVDNQILGIYGSSDKVQALGLVVSELISNACIHALIGNQDGQLHLNFLLKNGQVYIQIKDNGSGLPVGFSTENNGNFGMSFIRDTCQWLDAELDFMSDNGLSVILKISETKLQSIL